MKTDATFDAAASLYAEHEAVVSAMYKRYTEEIDDFLNGVRGAVAEILGEIVHEKTTDGYRYWHLGQPKQKDKVAHLWFGSRSSDIVKGKLTMMAVAPQAGDDDLKLLPAMAKAEFSQVCTPASGGKWSLFTVVVRYEPGAPVLEIAEPIAGLLTRMRGIQQATAKVRANEAARQAEAG